MNNTKLRGLQKIRQSKKLSRTQLATYLNLAITDKINFVVTSDYIRSIETMQQEYIPDDFLQYLCEYFQVTLDELIHVRRKNIKCNGHNKVDLVSSDLGRIINLDYTTLCDNKYTLHYEGTIQVPDIFCNGYIDLTCNFIFNAYETPKTVEEFKQILEVIIKEFEKDMDNRDMYELWLECREEEQATTYYINDDKNYILDLIRQHVSYETFANRDKEFKDYEVLCYIYSICCNICNKLYKIQSDYNIPDNTIHKLIEDIIDILFE